MPCHPIVSERSSRSSSCGRFSFRPSQVRSTVRLLARTILRSIGSRRSIPAGFVSRNLVPPRLPRNGSTASTAALGTTTNGPNYPGVRSSSIGPSSVRADRVSPPGNRQGPSSEASSGFAVSLACPRIRVRADFRLPSRPIFGADGTARPCLSALTDQKIRESL